MALTSARDILNKKILGTGGGVPSADEIPIDIEGLSATKLSVGLEEIVLDINQLSSSVLTIGEKVENIGKYSTEEHIVGKWIDGSDIYEVTTDLGESGVSVGGGTSADSNIPIGTIDFCIDAEGITPTKKAVNMGAELGTTYVKMSNPASVQRNIRWFTVRYTKTSPATTKRTTKKK